MYLLWKTSEENGLLGQSILGFMGTAWPSLFVSLKKELEVTMSVIKIEMPQAVREIIETLEGAGYEAFAVGGCVRDAVLGRIPAD